MNETLITAGGRSVLRFERRLAHPVHKVWQAVTDPAQLSEWFPSDMDIDLRPGGRIRFVFRNGEGPTLDGVITNLDPPTLFAYTWGDAHLRFELRPVADGCLLIFTHTFDDRPSAASFAAGWCTCLTALTMVLNGEPVQVLDDWAELHESYVEAFGLLEGTADETPDGWTVRFERQLTRPTGQVWAELTGAAHPATAEPAVGEPAPPPSTSRHAPAGAITAARAPALLEYQWSCGGEPAGRVRWELSDGPGGARVVLTQTVPARLPDHRAEALAAWRTHLQSLAGRLPAGAAGRLPS
jgi:uncharacterized protein YndB with AHSA1/START domain